MDKIVLQAADLDGYLTAADNGALACVEALYRRALKDFTVLERGGDGEKAGAEARLLAVFNELGERL